MERATWRYSRIVATTNAPSREFSVDTDEVGAILGSTEDARLVLGYTPRQAHGRSLPVMFSQGGPTVTELQQAIRGHFVDREAVILGRDQPIRVHYHIELALSKQGGNRLVLRWTFERL